jgi:hypothetical protein
MRFKFVLVLALISMLTMSSTVFAHGSHGGTADYHARVGEPFTFEGKLETKEQRPFKVHFQAVRLEDGAQILSMNSRSLNGSYKFAMQFFDGAEHQVTISLIDPKTNSVISEKKMKVEVEAFHPPMFIKMKTIAFLIIIIIIGMLSGVGITRLKKANRPMEGDPTHVI